MIPLSNDPATDYARLSGLLLMQHEFAAAYQSARRAMDAEPTQQAAVGAWFDAALATGHYTEVDSLLGRLALVSTGRRLREAQWYDAHGKSDLVYGSIRRVCDRFERAGMRPPAIAWCLTELARIEHSRSGADAAEQLFQRALRVEPGSRGALEGLADLAHARREWRKAKKLYTRIAVDAHPDLYLRLAEVHRAMHDEDRAQAYEREFLRVARAPGAEALYTLPLALFYANRAESRDSALAVVQRDLDRRSAVESWDVLSRVRFQRGELPQALEASDRAHAWGASSPTMSFHRAKILEAMHRGAEAAALMEQAMKDETLLEPYVRLEIERRPPFSSQ